MACLCGAGQRGVYLPARRILADWPNNWMSISHELEKAGLLGDNLFGSELFPASAYPSGRGSLYLR